MSVLAIIPARKGSRRVKRKNVRLLGGKPLVCWTFEVAKQAKSLDRIIVSTDDKKVRDLALKYNIEVPFFPRPSELSKDVDTTLVMIHCLRYLEKKEGYKPSLVCLLQPTSPFRFPEDVDRCVKIAKKTDCDTVVSVVQASQHPYWMFKPEEKNRQLILKSYEGIDLSGDVLVSQNLPKLFYPNGAVYITKTNLILNGRIFGRDIRGYEMPKWRSIDIEEEVDLLLAEAVLKWKMKKMER